MATTVASGDVGTPVLTLTAATIEAVTFGDDLDTTEVVNLSGTDSLWYTLDGSDPTVGGSKSYLVPPNAVDTREPPNNDNTVVKLISSGTPTVRVQRGN